MLEGVAFAFADAEDALAAAGTRIDAVSVIGGGARSRLWSRILASALDRPLVYRRGGELGPALGAARLARIAATGEVPDAVCRELEEDFVAEPEPRLVAHAAAREPGFRALYTALRETFNEAAQLEEA